MPFVLYLAHSYGKGLLTTAKRMVLSWNAARSLTIPADLLLVLPSPYRSTHMLAKGPYREPATTGHLWSTGSLQPNPLATPGARTPSPAHVNARTPLSA